MEKLPATLSLVSYKDPILKEVMPRFNFENPSYDPEELALKLVSCMKENGGIGLSCNQVGLRVNAFVMMAEPAIVCFNPKVVDTSSESETALESCLTYKGVAVKVSRKKVIKVRFTLYTGETVTKQYQDMTSRVFLHELSHLNGRTMFDDANYLNREIARKKFKKLCRQSEKFDA
jgi:peptide deformylase